MKRISIVFAFALSTALPVALPAHADGWPASIAGAWSVTANDTGGTLQISQPASTARCKAISGSIFGDPIVGFYCPFSGHLAFQRTNGVGNVQDYSGALSEATVVPRNMSGSFASLIFNLGDFSFFATKN